jgi:hypothetical protein
MSASVLVALGAGGLLSAPSLLAFTRYSDGHWWPKENSNGYRTI